MYCKANFAAQVQDHNFREAQGIPYRDRGQYCKRGKDSPPPVSTRMRRDLEMCVNSPGGIGGQNQWSGPEAQCIGHPRSYVRFSTLALQMAQRSAHAFTRPGLLGSVRQFAMLSVYCWLLWEAWGPWVACVLQGVHKRQAKRAAGLRDLGATPCLALLPAFGLLALAGGVAARTLSGKGVWPGRVIRLPAVCDSVVSQPFSRHAGVPVCRPAAMGE